MVTLLLKRSEYFSNVSVLLVTEKFLAAVMGRKRKNECFGIKKETTRLCAYSAILTEH
jgi:hypothetical protein